MSALENPPQVNTASRKKLRLLYISNPNLIHTRRWVSWFADHGHTVCLLGDVPLKEPWSEVPVIDLSKIFYVRYVRFLVWTLWIRRFIGQWHPDILHAHRINSAGWMAAASGFHPYIITPWGLDIFVQPQQSWLARQLAVYTLKHSDLTTTISDTMSSLAIELGANPDKLRSVQFGAELDIFNPGSSNSLEVLELRRRLSLPQDARVVFSPRAVTPLYNLDIIVEAIPEVLKHFSNAYFIFLDYNTEDEYKKQLVTRSNELGLNAIIRWVPATRSRLDMARLYHLSEIVVSIPSIDGTPVSVLEAMACGKPVISSDLLPLREFITSGQSGLLVPVRETLPLAEGIIRLLEEPGQAAEYGRKAHEVVANKANSDLEMRRMEDIYYQLAEIRRV